MQVFDPPAPGVGVVELLFPVRVQGVGLGRAPSKPGRLEAQPHRDTDLGLKGFLPSPCPGLGGRVTRGAGVGGIAVQEGGLKAPLLLAL